MKKRYFMLSIAAMLILSGCSMLISEASFSPPSWIIGTWADAFDINVYTFTSDNVVLTVSSVSVDFAEAYKNASVSETTTSALYEVNVAATGTNSKYKFAKINDTSLNYSITNNGITVGPLVLYKR